jgi:hypothetical protein
LVRLQKGKKIFLASKRRLALAAKEEKKLLLRRSSLIWQLLFQLFVNQRTTNRKESLRMSIEERSFTIRI